MIGLRNVILSLTLLLAACQLPAQTVDLTAFDTTDSFYQVKELHERKTLTAEDAADRDGWLWRKDTVRFGAFGFSAEQRVNPVTQLPDQTGNKWGDNFLGVTNSKKPEFYMASNWSSFNFLSAAIRLKGETKDIPQPTQRGRLMYLTLREVTRDRAMAEAVWKDPMGGYLRVRFIGIRGADRFTITVRYIPPPGKELESTSFSLNCQPYDLNNRGYWERTRWMRTPARDQALTDAKVDLDLTKEWQVVLHNRFAHNDSGTVFAVHPATVKSVSIAGTYSVNITLTPKTPDGEVVALCGDWVYEAYVEVANKFFAQLLPIANELDATSKYSPPLPLRRDTSGDVETDALLEIPALRDKYAADVNASRTAVQQAWEALDNDRDNPACYDAWLTATNKYTQLELDIRATIMKERLWDK